MSREEREAVIRSRKKVYAGPRKRLSAEEIREYSRSIPGSWRKQIIADAGGTCAHCGKRITTRNAHIDHIVPFSKGGKTVLANLQALYADCNLAKGNKMEN